MKKRKNGEGTYGTKTIRGYVYKYYKFADGKYVYAKTSSELEKKRKEYEEREALLIVDNQCIFSDYCLKWLKGHAKLITARAYDDYESAINNRIKDTVLGNVQLHAINHNTINKWLDRLATKYAKSTINKTWMLVKQVLRYGMEEGEIPPIQFKKVIVPKEKDVATKKKVVPFIDMDDMETLYQHIQSNKYSNEAQVIIFMMYSGLRISEAISVKWEDLSKDYSVLHVRNAQQKAIKRDKDLEPIRREDGSMIYEHISKETKSEAGTRTIPLPSRAVEAIKVFEKYKRHNSDYVFVTSNRTQYSIRNIQRKLEELMKKYGGSRTDYSPHSLRHGYGSVLISEGVDIKIVSELLGHTDVAFTYNTYIGILRKDKINAVMSVFDRDSQKE